MNNDNSPCEDKQTSNEGSKLVFDGKSLSDRSVDEIEKVRILVYREARRI